MHHVAVRQTTSPEQTRTYHVHGRAEQGDREHGREHGRVEGSMHDGI